MDNDNSAAWAGFDDWLAPEQPAPVIAGECAAQPQPTPAERAAAFARAKEIRRAVIATQLPDDHPYIRKHGRIHPDDR